MRAVVRRRYGPISEVLRLRPIERPEPAEDEVLVRVHAAAVAIGDWLEIRGYPYIARPGYGLREPRHAVAGNELAGRVEAVGARARSFRPGDDVFGSAHGALAEFVAVPEATLAPKPSNLSFGQAAAVPISGIAALQALRDGGRIEAGQRVAILGASGGVGTYAVQLAKAFGARVTAVCGPGSVELVRSIGADQVVDYTVEDLARADLRRALTPRGTLVMVGGSGGPWTMGFERTIGGALLSPFVSQRLRPFFSKVTRIDLVFLKDLIETGDVTPVIDREYALEAVHDALEHVGERHTMGKTVVTI
jgi:NADPH:quinone reductase-like Zn-dependent oxidoreductase